VSMGRLILLMVLFLVTPEIQASTIYQWEDGSGVVHFTDSEFKVPVEYRGKSARQLEALSNIDKASKVGVRTILDGKVLYERKCAVCHVLGFKNEGKREALAWAIIDDNTKRPRSSRDLFMKMRRVVDGSIDMPVLDISDEDLMAITNYLIKDSQL